MTVRVGVIGAHGRMGREVVRAVEAADDLELVAALGSGDALDRLVEAGTEVAVDFTRPDAVMGTVERLVGSGVHAVIGTSGFDEDRLATLDGWVSAAPGVGVVVAPNFALGAVLLGRFAAVAAPYFESVEIIELHHPDKVDAPSGTAQHTARAVAQARRAAAKAPSPDATTHALPGVRGADVAGVPVHAIRLRGLVAHEEVLLGNAGEVLTLRHDSTDRSSFMPGVLLAVRQVGTHPGLTVGLERFLD